MLADKYAIDLYINESAQGIAADWDFALECAKTPLVTIAHQDDIYCPAYSRQIIELAQSELTNPLILFSDYGEIRNGKRVASTANLKIKRLLMSSLKRRGSISLKSEKLKLLRFGSPISCPAVTYNMETVKRPVFDKDFKCSLDWRAWEQLAHQEGSFCFCPEILMYHRIHEGSETSASIASNVRSNEDLEMFKKFWPAPLATLLGKVYAASLRSNG